MAKVDAGVGDGNGPFEQFFNGYDLLPPPAWPSGGDTWRTAHDYAARALDVRAEVMVRGYRGTALAIDTQHLAELAVRVGLGMPPHFTEIGAFDVAERALAEIPDDAVSFRVSPSIQEVIRRALYSGDRDATRCARLAGWIHRWARACADVVLEHGGPTEGPGALLPSLRGLAEDLRRVAAIHAQEGKEGAANVEAIAAFIVAELRRADGRPFDGVDLPMWARPVAPIPPAIAGQRAPRNSVKAPLDALVGFLETMKPEDCEGAAFIEAARRYGWGPDAGQAPEEAPWEPWHLDALDRCREDSSARAEYPNATARYRAAAQVALRELGYDSNRIASAARQQAWRGRV